MGDDLTNLAGRLGYKPGWSFKVAGPGGRWLCVFAATTDSLHPDRHRVTQHMWEIPDGLDERGMARWVFDRLLDAERHEAAEFFRWDGHMPFWPNHQDEGSPYDHVERWEHLQSP